MALAGVNVQSDRPLEFEGKTFGKLSFGTDGSAQISLYGELDELQHDILVSNIQRFYQRHIHKRAEKKAAIEKMTWKQTNKLAAKLNVQMEEMQISIDRQAAYEKAQAEQETPGNAADSPKME